MKIFKEELDLILKDKKVKVDYQPLDSDFDESKELSNSSVELSRSLVDYTSEQASIPYDELLTDGVYAETLKEATIELGKASEFFRLLSSFSDEMINEQVGKLFI